MNAPPPTGLYVHWPYCARICPYCDFNVAKARAVDEAAWLAAFDADLRHWRARFGARTLKSLYFGGGTPSLMSAALIGRVADRAAAVFGLAGGAEVTLEANPNDVTQAALAAWDAAGVNRLSLGVQSFDDGQLSFLGRDHDGQGARRAVDRMLSAFGRSTFDLIYALPGEGAEAWRARLERAIATGVRHLSLYQLTIEPGTAFDRAVARGQWSPPGEGLDADLYEATAVVAAASGLPSYEVSSYAAPEHEAVHNKLYWQGADWFAIGPGAHGRITTRDGRIATEGARTIGAYLATPPPRRLLEETLTPDEVLTETLSGGLRMTAGLPLDDLGPQRKAIVEAAAPLIGDGLLAVKEDRLAATPQGRLVLDAVTAALLGAV